VNLLYVGAVLVAVGLFCAVLTVNVGSGGPTGVAKSLMLIDGSVDQRTAVKSELGSRDRLILPLFNQTRSLAGRLSPAGAEDRLTKLLDRAGNPEVWSVERIMGAKGAALFVGGLLGLAYGGLTFKGVLFAFVGAAACFFVPDLLIYNLGLKRQEETSKSLADALDMLTVCVEAGQGFDAALLQVARNVDGPISGEFARVLSEIQIGKSRGEAFSAMGDRVSLPEVKNFITALVQADRLGLPIAGVLREQTAAMRLARRQKAEEKAQKVTVKILFPLMLCILPALFVVVIGPGVLRLMHSLMGM
jgi:tight adherence protein C